MARRRVGVIGGTGLYRWAAKAEEIEVDTPYGQVALQHAALPEADVFFLARHGPTHSVPAHRVNHRAHMYAMRAAAPDYVVGVYNVGAVDPALPDGTWALLSDFVDLRGGPPITFHDEETVHVDMGQPFCPTARAALASHAPRGTRGDAVYACVSGPRFDTAAETRAMRAWGADVVGMTAAPEVTLAREAGLCYAGVALVANAAASRGVVRAADVQGALAAQASRARTWITTFARHAPAKKSCRCRQRSRAGRLAPAVAA